MPPLMYRWRRTADILVIRTFETVRELLAGRAEVLLINGSADAIGWQTSFNSP
jgi:hypothetical protein